VTLRYVVARKPSSRCGKIGEGVGVWEPIVGTRVAAPSGVAPLPVRSVAVSVTVRVYSDYV
jgi:hypothetical protein